VAAWWAAYGLRLFPPLRHAAWRATRLLFPYEQVVVWFGAVLLAMAAASFSARSISIW
jgi:hypothetical protein